MLFVVRKLFTSILSLNHGEKDEFVGHIVAVVVVVVDRDGGGGVGGGLVGVMVVAHSMVSFLVVDIVGFVSTNELLLSSSVLLSLLLLWLWILLMMMLWLLLLKMLLCLYFGL